MRKALSRRRVVEAILLSLVLVSGWVLRADHDTPAPLVSVQTPLDLEVWDIAWMVAG